MLALGHSPYSVHSTHLCLLAHNMTSHTPEGPLPLPRNTTSRNPPAVTPLDNTLPPPHLNDKSLLSNAPGKRERLALTPTPSTPPFTSPMPHKSTHSPVTPTHRTHLPPMHTEHATGNYNFTLELYNPLEPTTSSTSPPHTYNLKTGATLSSSTHGRRHPLLSRVSPYQQP